ncbi:putative GLYCOGEN DEBRANCHING ENZYME [Vibrio nigripulchritudo MADA3029]|uniref:glycogen debranching protein GlgX n=1 Tax=Vibrio nigripulchritudo TaxID=28173 RepID=UPI0003B1ACE8|nr:glycogen debranching protein GlgX [Vibrio nigripulchritudo]CCN49454.1 putative GLYCOGEN DEBRANCHING ENZYME [Vibrio nigripulchritudo MADA3020]CCN51289.1 putative GLYCOGEN DEBRANCHING ENZYME [Vibrio nigripulchritudo MADA3021]CCN59925.1 putative GLYCOGEN DEBRANCHING ENZYME [Vibrio nigripulchritudo MADA3029]
METNKARPFPLGATLDSMGCNFSVHAPDAEDIQLALFDSDDEFVCYPMNSFRRGIKAVYIENIQPGQKYGYITNHNDEELLVSDPYAKSLSAPLHYVPPYTSEKSWELAKSVVIQTDFDWQGVTSPNRPREDLVLFETHVKGLTQLHPEIAESQQGTYLALASKPMLEFYKKQGINTLQLLPIAACMHEPHLLEQGMQNYWGYNPFVFMAPDPRYAEKNAVIELKTAIRELHRHGIEVILDVVYNHTAEGGIDGPAFNLKTLDTLHYLSHEGQFSNYTGCGNTLDLTHQPTLNLVMDTLRYWIEEYHIDGFRFDLAATLGRNRDHFNHKASFFQAVGQDPVLRETKLIAEPWDIGPHGYQVGGFPDGWNECNDKFRDISRSFWRGDQGYLKEFATRLMGSRDIYSASRWPEKLTINYVTYHDGFTLQDLVSYKHKNNLKNGESNRDGHGDNRSANYGVEGETNNMLIKAMREKQKRNFMASLLFSFGIPHILTADVLSHSQDGNNNAYCQDNELSWLNWNLTENQKHFKDWLATVIEGRRKYMMPFVRAFSGDTRNDNRVSWLRTDGEVMSHDDWNVVSAIALHLGIGETGNELLYLINQSSVPARYKLPDSQNQHWQIICDTSLNHKADEEVSGEQLVTPMSLMILHN